MSDEVELILGLEWADALRAVRLKIALLLRDFVAVSIAGRPAPTATSPPVAEATRASSEELLGAVAVGYEVALRAGMHLHARGREYHASGAWGGLGAAAAAARLLGCDWT